MTICHRPSEFTPGVNIDRIDVNAGIEKLQELGYEDNRTLTVIDYALRRWARGEEEAAEKGAIDQSFYGIDFTSWRIVLAHAIATAEEKVKAKT